MDFAFPSLSLETGDTPHRWEIDKPLFSLGRSSDQDIVLPDRLVSRQHAQIRQVGTQYILEDQGSTNGTYVNGRRIRTCHTLQDGDVIQVAPRFNLRFVARDLTPRAGPPGLPPLELTAEGYRVTIGGQEVPLSAPQYALLALLKGQKGKVVSREEIVRHVWPMDEAAGISAAAVDALVRRLRERLAEVDPEHSYVRTVRGHGFRFENR